MCNYVVELPQPYPEPYDCPSCRITHPNKAIHLRLNSNGDVFVSEGILALLQQVGLAGMEVANQVNNAPPQIVGAVEVPTLETRIADRRFYVPGRTRAESERIAQAPLMPALEQIAEKVDRKRSTKLSRFFLGGSG
jgi:hypothetical protein